MKYGSSFDYGGACGTLPQLVALHEFEGMPTPDHS